MGTDLFESNEASHPVRRPLLLSYVHTSAIGQAANEPLTIGDGQNIIQIPTREK
jgi:hypothetical protein